MLTGDSVPWETAVDRKTKRTLPEETMKDPEKTNVTVLILQQVGLFSTWWAASEDKMSIGLAGRCVFSFASASEPGHPKMSEFGNRVALPLMKDLFRSMLLTLGPHAPLPTDSPLLSWASDEKTQEEVHLYRCLCHELTKTRLMDETFATCLNKSGYWLSVVAFLNTLLEQMWVGVLEKKKNVSLCPRIGENAVKASMDFFTYRFLFGASVLCADLRRRTWTKARKSQVVPKESRCHAAAALLLKASCGLTITGMLAARAAPVFRHLLGTDARKAEQAKAAYMEALKYLVERGYGLLEEVETEELPVLKKRHYGKLPESCKEQLAEIHAHPISFGLHLPCLHDAAAGDHEEEQPGPRLEATDEAPDVPQTIVQDAATELDSEGPEDVAEPAGHKKETKQEEGQEKAGQDQGRSVFKPAVLRERIEDSYRTVFDGNTRTWLRNYEDFRKEVCFILGSQKDPGVYTFVDKGQRGVFRRLSATCKKTACEKCTVAIWAFYKIENAEGQLRIQMRGQHGQLRKPEGGRMWTAAEEQVVQGVLEKGELSTAAIRAAFKQKGMLLRCNAEQLHSFVGRTRKKEGVAEPRNSKPVTAGELMSSVLPFQVQNLDGWEQLPVHQLLVLPGAVADAERVCIVFTCPGMIGRARAAVNKVVKLAVDGKQKLVSNEYTIVTVSFLVPNQIAKLTRGRKRVDRVKAHTCTQEPFVQALVNSEAEENMTQTFEAACKIANEQCGVDLQQQVLQVHKDYAKGLEASRIKVFPRARRCDDYPHMRRAAYKTLESLFGVGAGKENKQKRHKDFDRLDEIITISRTLPTIQLFDCVWQLTFAWLRATCPAAGKYLEKTYFQKVQPENLQKQMRCACTHWGATGIMFAGFWSGIIGTYPGSSSGSQTLESFHSYWQAGIQARARAKPTAVLRCMQDMYRDDWQEKFQWAEERSFLTWPETAAEALYNSESLRQAGRSPAVDFWKAREGRGAGKTNYYQVWVRTDGQHQSVDAAGITTFWVCRSVKCGGVTPADAVITKEFGTCFANLIACEGPELEKWLVKSGIVTEVQAQKKSLNIDKLKEFFGRHCAVIEGHLPNSCWPRQQRKMQSSFRSIVCTCLEFLMHGECEHVVYVEALKCPEAAAAMENVPVIRKKGRKRKGEKAPKAPKAAAAKKRKAQAGGCLCDCSEVVIVSILSYRLIGNMTPGSDVTRKASTSSAGWWNPGMEV